MDGPGLGLVKTTLVDYPGLVAAVVFTPGCNLRCPWCHNPGLVQPPWDPGLLPEAEVLAFLEKRRPVLQGVVITGGEPLAHHGLVGLLQAVKALGYRVKLDTNGTFPDRLAALAPGLVDAVALDVKNAPSVYPRSTGVTVDTQAVADTLALVRSRFTGAGEVRLTWVPGLNCPEDLDEYAGFVGPGVPVWVQAYRPGTVLEPTRAATRAPTPLELEAVVAALVARGVDARLR